MDFFFFFFGDNLLQKLIINELVLVLVNFFNTQLMNFYFPAEKKKQIDEFFCMSNVGYVWYMHLEIKNYYLKIFIKIYVNKKIHKNI